MPTPLQRATRRMRRTAPQNEQARYYKLLDRSVKRANLAATRKPSLGTVTNAERRSIRAAALAVRLITTPGEAQGVKKILRRKARRS